MSDDNLILRDLIGKIETLTSTVSEMKSSVTGTLAEHSTAIVQLQKEKVQLFDFFNNDCKDVSKSVVTIKNSLKNLEKEVEDLEKDVNKGLEESRNNTTANKANVAKEQARAKSWRRNEAIAILLLMALGAWVGMAPKEDNSTMKLLLKKLDSLQVDDERKGKK